MIYGFSKRLILLLFIMTYSLYGYTPAIIMDKNYLNNENSYIKVGLDAVKSFNKKYKTNIPILTFDSTYSNKEDFLTQIAKDKYDPIISLSFLFSKEIEKVSKQFPKKTFVEIDGNTADAKNILNIYFKEQEGAFLVGAIAALHSKSNVIGFIGGMDLDVIRSFGCGFIQGVKYINPEAKVLVAMVGEDFTAFDNPKKAKEIAKQMIKKNADVIFHAADRSGKGLIEAAIEHNIYAIGVDINQNALAPETVLTSMLKRVDVAVYKVLLDTMNNQLSRDDLELGLKENGVSWALDKYNIDLFSKTTLDKIDLIEFDIINDIIEIEDYVKKQKCSCYNFENSYEKK